jgi:hypothetical protein
MTGSHPRLLRALILCTFCLGGQVAVVSIPTPAAERGCESLRRWARQFEGRSPSLEEVSRFDRGHGLAIFNAIAPVARANLWREQLARFADRAGLTDDQRALILQARADITTTMYEKHGSAPSDPLRQFWKARVEPLFPEPEHRRAWLVLGGVLPSADQRPSRFERLSAAFRPNAQLPYCECNFSYGQVECYPMEGCISSSCSGWVGCGPQGREWCVGMCGS